MNRVEALAKRWVSPRSRRRIAFMRVRLRRGTSFARPMPSFLIIGTHRGGTSSLYKYLEGHPDLSASIRKETEYFSARFGEGDLGTERTSLFYRPPTRPTRIRGHA